MKKIIIALCVISILMISVGFVVAGNQAQTVEEGTRYLIKSDNAALKVMYGVRHNFDAGFTTDLSPRQLKILEKFGVEVEEVEIYSITARPTCDYDDICEPEIGENPSCADCKSIVEDPEPEPPPEPDERSCYPDVQTPWGIERVNGGSGGTNIIVAVLDTGIDQDHLDLISNIHSCVAFGRYISCEDDNGHGTHVSGTIAANGGYDSLGIMGVAPEAKLMAIKVLDRKGRGYTDDIAAGMIYAVDNGAHIISMSLGGGESDFINDAVDYANGKGVLVIAAAGNSGPRLNSIIYPAANPGVVAVAAFDVNNDIADFSSRGLNDGDWIIEAREIEFAAPGVSVLSTYNNGCYATGSGTSMATPHISGIAARDWKFNPQNLLVEASETRTYLQGLAEAYTVVYDYGQEGDDIEAGFGLPIAPITA